MSKINIKPKQGLKVRKPDGSHLADKGETVKRNAFWLRRLKDGDVELVKAPTEEEVAEEKPSKKAVPKQTTKKVLKEVSDGQS